MMIYPDTDIYNFQTVKTTNSSIHPVESPYLWKHSKDNGNVLFTKFTISF